jgi:branched-subunit amino acid aminotransferase/4-amino-4-deoxychorismate lyase
VIWRNGVLVEDEARWRPPMTRAGVFTTVGCLDGRPLLWERHHRRLSLSVRDLFDHDAAHLPTEFDLRRLLDATGLVDAARLRVVATVDDRAPVVEAAGQAVAGPLQPPRLRSVAWTPRAAGDKVLDRQAWNDAAQFAAERGADDALLVTGDGRVHETSVANVWLVADGALVTPPAPERCLPGVMRSWLLDQAPHVGLPAEQRDVALDEVLAADEVWISNAVIGVQPVRALDDRRWSVWPILQRIREVGIPAPLA